MTRAGLQVRTFPGTDPRLARCHAIRHTVFITEQGVPEGIEVDGRDGSATHFLAVLGGRDTGAARMRLVDFDSVGLVAKAERVAVLAGTRGSGVGRALMDALEAAAARAGAVEVRLGAQVTAVPFYLRLHYEPYDAPFMEAGIEHRMMRKAVGGQAAAASAASKA
jgi:predicted GNAT family N-acyltransferase